jgi:hypothetical protein
MEQSVLDLTNEAKASAQVVALHVAPISSTFQTALDGLGQAIEDLGNKLGACVL